MVMARFLLFIGGISWYRAALGMGVRLPIWLLPLALGLFLLSVTLYLRRRLAAPLPLKTGAISSGACCGGAQGREVFGRETAGEKRSARWLPAPSL